MSNSRTFYRGAIEYIGGTVTADGELTDSDTVEVSFDREDWMSAEWVGDEGTSRGWRLLVGDDNPLPDRNGPTQVYLRITDNPEVPIINAGVLNVL